MAARAGPEIQNFLDQLRSRPKVAEAIERDPVFARHFIAIGRGIEEIYVAGNDDPVWLERFDQIRELLGRKEMTIKDRLIELGRLCEPWHAEILRRRN